MVGAQQGVWSGMSSGGGLRGGSPADIGAGAHFRDGAQVRLMLPGERHHSFNALTGLIQAGLTRGRLFACSNAM